MAKPKAQKTWIPHGNEIERKWYLVDAKGVVLGRLATRVATVLMGKHKPTFTPFRDMGDHVIVVNAAMAAFSGEKQSTRMYMDYSHFKGGESYISLGEWFKKEPEEVVRYSIRRMLPKTFLGDQMIRKLKVYAGEKHGHSAQKPVPLDLQRLRRGRICLSTISGAPAAGSRP
jgi:large subunit ribosomal protein L13